MAATSFIPSLTHRSRKHVVICKHGFIMPWITLNILSWYYSIVEAEINDNLSSFFSFAVHGGKYQRLNDFSLPKCWWIRPWKGNSTTFLVLFFPLKGVVWRSIPLTNFPQVISFYFTLLCTLYSIYCRLTINKGWRFGTAWREVKIYPDWTVGWNGECCPAALAVK